MVLICTSNGVTIALKTGPEYTRTGEKESENTQKGLAFHLNWEEFLKGNPVTKPDLVSDDAWIEINSLLFNGKSCTSLNWAKRLYCTYSLNLLQCTEEDLKVALQKYIFSSDQKQRPITKQSSIADICTDVRNLFRYIGREYDYAVDKTIELGKFSMNIRNPMTTALEKALKQELHKNNKANKINSAPGKLCGTTNIHVAYTINMHLLDTLIKKIKVWSSSKKTSEQTLKEIINLANLCILCTFCIHEGCRPSEVTVELTHNDLWIPLHQHIPFLTIAFLDIDIITYILKNNLLSQYCMGLWKGKKAQEIRPRAKHTIPIFYNSFDLLTVYVFCMKCILTIQPDIISRKVTFKQIKNISSMLSRKVKKLGINNFAWYSIRYAAAYNDKMLKDLNEEWTRLRMGHTKTSKMKEKYASNKSRVTVDNEEINVAVYDYTQSCIEREFLPLDKYTVTYSPSWISSLPQEMQERFEMTQNKISSFLKGESEIPEHTKDTSWMKNFPFGFHVDFSEDLKNDKIVTLLKESIKGISQHVDIISDQTKPKPVLTGFQDIIYGNWQILDISRQSKKRVGSELQYNDSASKKSRLNEDNNIIHKSLTHKTDTPIENQNIQYDIRKIFNGDTVIIRCLDNNDKYALNLPSDINKSVIIMKVSRITDKDPNGLYATLQGKLYTNEENDATKTLVYDKKSNRTLNRLSYIDVLSVIGKHHGILHKLEDDEIEEIC